MATINQINASRANGARSKGPVTPAGKARVGQNSAKHGIYSKVVVLQNEDHSMYMESRKAHLEEWAPANLTEHNLVIDIVDARWRLLRFSSLETAAFDLQIESMRAEIDEEYSAIDESTRSVISFAALIGNNRAFEVLQTAIRAQHRIIERATSQLIRLRKTGVLNSDPNPDTGGGGTSTTAAGHGAADPTPETGAGENPGSIPDDNSAATASGTQRSENGRSKPETAAMSAADRFHGLVIVARNDRPRVAPPPLATAA